MHPPGPPVAPVLRFAADHDGGPPVVLRAGGGCPHARRPSGGPPLLVLRHTPHVLSALRDPRFAMAGVTPGGGITRFPLTGAEMQSPDGGLLNMDPPALREYRRRISSLFSRRAAQATLPAVRAIAADLTAGLRGRDQIDARAEFAEPFTAAAVCYAMGIPPADHDRVAAFARTAFAVVPDPSAVPQVAAAWQGLYGYYAAVMPRAGGLAGQLAGALQDRSAAQRVHVAGTVSNGFGAVLPVVAVSLALTAQRPGVIAACLSGGTPSWQALADRLLRGRVMFPVALPRVALADIQLGGLDITRGTTVLPSLTGAAQDEVRAPCSIAFGAGPHFCPGAALARAWLAVALQAFWTAFPRARLSAGLQWQAGTLPVPRDIQVRVRRCALAGPGRESGGRRGGR